MVCLSMMIILSVLLLNDSDETKDSEKDMFINIPVFFKQDTLC